MVQALKAKMKEQKGFTLIELLAVIVILGIIAAIAIPAIGNVINKSDNKAKVQEGIQIINAAKLYVANSNDVGFTNTGTEAAPVLTKTLTSTDLTTYLDHVKDNGFTVKVEKNNSTGKYTYSITNHDSVTVLGGTKDSTYKTEQELISWSN